MTRARLLVVSALATALLTGCGGGDDPAATSSTADGGQSAGGADLADLASYLPADAQLISEVDLAGVREQLGLEAEADATDVESITDGDVTLDDPQGELVVAGGIGLPPVSAYFATLKADPVIAALDGTKITAAVSNQSDPNGQVEALRTEQPFASIADQLVKQGYDRKSDSLSKPGAAIDEVADAGDGVLVLTSDGDYSAAELAESPPGGPKALISLLGPAGDPIAIANSLSDGCMTAFGGRERADASAGTLRMQIDGEPQVDDLDLKPLETVGITAGTPEVNGAFIEVPFEAKPQPGGNPIGQAIGTLKPDQLYDCG